MRPEESCSDVLTELLLDASTLDHTHDRSLCCSDPQDQVAAPAAKRKSRAGRRRVTPSDQLREERREASVLSQQLQDLVEARQLRRSLDRLLDLPNADVMTWKECAMRVRYARETAEDEKSELMKQICSNATLLEYVKCLLSVQRNRLPQFRLLTQCSSPALDGDDVQLFHLMKTRLDHQHSQLDAILLRCVASVDAAERTETRNHADGRGMDVLEFGVKPFDAPTVASTVQQYFEGRSHVRWQGENEVYLRETVAAEDIGAACSDGAIALPPSDVRNRGVARGFVHQNQFVMLWQTVSDWDSDRHDGTEPETTRLWKHGWVVIRSLGESASLVQAGMTAHIQLSPESEQQSPDPEVLEIVQTLDAYGKRQLQIVDNILLDTAMRRS